MDQKVNFVIYLLVIILLLGVFLGFIDKIENIFGIEVDFIPEDEPLHPEGYTFPPEERGYFAFSQNL